MGTREVKQRREKAHLPRSQSLSVYTILNKVLLKGAVPSHTEPTAAGMPASQPIPFHLDYPCCLHFLFKKKNHRSVVVTPLRGNEDCKRGNGRQAFPIDMHHVTHIHTHAPSDRCFSSSSSTY